MLQVIVVAQAVNIWCMYNEGDIWTLTVIDYLNKCAAPFSIKTEWTTGVQNGSHLDSTAV